MLRRPSSSLVRNLQCPTLRFKSSLQQPAPLSSPGTHHDSTVPIFQRQPVIPYPMPPQQLLDHHRAPHIRQPPYASSGLPPPLLTTEPEIHSDPGPLRRAGRLARQVLELACRHCQTMANSDSPPLTGTQLNAFVHQTILDAGAYPSPLNYMGFPKSVCTSVNEVICHGIPDDRPFAYGDVVSLDVSCYSAEGVHGDNCATVIVGDVGDNHDNSGRDWQGVPHRTEFATAQCAEHFRKARRLIKAAEECLQAGIEEVRPGGCLSMIGAACQSVAESYGCSSVEAYRGHGIGRNFHVPPFVSHVRNTNKLELRPGMIFTIEPMICENSAECFEWQSDNWTVATVDGGLSAQFEHMVLVTETGYEILTQTQELSD